MIPDRPLDPPERPLTKYEADAGLAARARSEVARNIAMVLVLSGTGPFWRHACKPMEAWDNEQEFAIAGAVREALADETLTDAERWAFVMARVRLEGEKYAAWKAEEVSDET